MGDTRSRAARVAAAAVAACGAYIQSQASQCESLDTVASISGSRLGEPSEYSVGELLRNRMGGDRWHLALVQRDEVWDVERMGRLLDSLLAGYPVGALLLCRTDKRGLQGHRP